MKSILIGGFCTADFPPSRSIKVRSDSWLEASIMSYLVPDNFPLPDLRETGAYLNPYAGGGFFRQYRMMQNT